MGDTDSLRYTKIPLNNGSDEIPALGFGTLIPDPIATTEAVRNSLQVGFRQYDCAERRVSRKTLVGPMAGSPGAERPGDPGQPKHSNPRMRQ